MNSSLRHNFDSASDVRDLFATEDLMRMNSAALRAFCRQTIVDHQWGLSLIAFDHFISLSDGQMRKDGITPSEHHEHTHFLRLMALMKTVNDRLGYDHQKYGTVDALVTALYFHDLIEDRTQTKEGLLEALNEGIDQKLLSNQITIVEADIMRNDAICAIEMVRVMSRNEKESGIELNRSKYNNRWIKNPGAVIIKLIDWTNKLATMPGVEAFEKDDQDRMKRNLAETDHMFVDERQAVAETAMKRHRGCKKIFKILDAEMSVVFNMVKGYVFHATSGVDSSPEDEPPFNFTKLRTRLGGYIANMPCDGANQIEITANRIKKNACLYPKVDAYYANTLEPAIKPFKSKAPANELPVLSSRLN